MTQVVLPRTDTAVLAELIVTVVVAAALLWLVRRHRDVRLVVVGALMLWVASMGLRTVH